ncbi:uncharacterized protein K02A2.6-like [Macrosteles quadrilineatus]|uniref:uncharacterized protein K02A2.6-like n=1 Tax=Macrosteles quadrilineatus TaxID=74068 RepID=UPI0023E0B7B9|nr:uncharacterized protein K02A2.6-like [Macrosteles quadrilineatus]
MLSLTKINMGPCIVIPRGIRNEMLKRLHYPHLGVTKTQLRAKNVMYWPQMNSQISDVISKCETCILNANSNVKEPLMPHKVPKLPWDKVGIDIFFFEDKKFLLVVDYLSKYVEVVILQNMTSVYVVNSLKSVFSRHGIPRVVISGFDTSFNSSEFENFSKCWEFKHVRTSPHYSQSNGMVERAVQSVKNLIKKSVLEKTDLYLALLELRNTPISCNLPSPAEILFSRKLNGILPCQDKMLRPRVQKNVRKNLILRQDSQKRYYDRGAKPLRPLQVNEHALMKYKNKWVKGQIVGKRDEPRSYIVQSERSDKTYVRNRRDLRPFNVSCKPYFVSSNDVPGVNPKSPVKTRSPIKSPSHNLRHSQSPLRPILSPAKEVTSSPERPNSPRHVHFPADHNHYTTRSGRMIKPVDKMNLVRMGPKSCRHVVRGDYLRLTGPSLHAANLLRG